MRHSFLRRLDSAREAANVPFVITSGARCAEHNKKTGSRPSSSHVKLVAADISAPTPYMRFQILYGLLDAGFKRIGVGLDFIHVDEDLEKPQELVWLYT
jgi:hypothetical protein